MTKSKSRVAPKARQEDLELLEQKLMHFEANILHQNMMYKNHIDKQRMQIIYLDNLLGKIDEKLPDISNGKFWWLVNAWTIVKAIYNIINEAKGKKDAEKEKADQQRAEQQRVEAIKQSIIEKSKADAKAVVSASEGEGDNSTEGA